MVRAISRGSGGGMSVEPPSGGPQQETPQEEPPPSRASQPLKLVWEKSGILLAGLVVLTAVVTMAGGGGPSFGPAPIPSGSPTLGVAPQLPSPSPHGAELVPATSAPRGICSMDRSAFWMKSPLLASGPLGPGYYMAWDPKGIYLWQPQLGHWLPFPLPRAANQWEPLVGTRFSVCVFDSLVFGKPRV